MVIDDHETFTAGQESNCNPHIYHIPGIRLMMLFDDDRIRCINTNRLERAYVEHVYNRRHFQSRSWVNITNIIKSLSLEPEAIIGDVI